MAVARYDGHADWYDDWRKPHAASTAREVADLLGPGGGLCLDLGCGTGLFLDALAATGRAVVGLDRSADQLRIAGGRRYPGAPDLPDAGMARGGAVVGRLCPQAVGMSHHSLADVLNAFVRTGLAIEHVAELGDRPVPNNLTIRARKGP